MLKEFLEKEQVTVRLGRKLLGLMAVASQVVPLGLLHMRPLQRPNYLCLSFPKTNKMHTVT